jgi:hypothetical protein
MDFQFRALLPGFRQEENGHTIAQEVKGPVAIDLNLSAEDSNS